MATSSDPIVYPVTEGDSPTLYRAVTINDSGVEQAAVQADFSAITFQVFGTSPVGPEVEITAGPVTLNIPDVIDDTPPTSGLLAGMNFNFQPNDYLLRGNRRRRVVVTFTLVSDQTFKRSWILWTENVPGSTPTGDPPGAILLATLNQLVNKAAADATDQAVLRRLDQALLRADAYARRYCRWNLTADDFTEYHAWTNGEIVLRQQRVTALSGTSAEDDDFDYGVHYDVDRLWPASSLLVADTDYRLHDDGGSGILRRLAGGWATGWSGEWRGSFETTRVKYRAGYEEDEIPADLTGAVLEVALQMYLRDTSSQTSISSGGAGAITKIRRGQSEISYSNASSSTSTTTRSGASGGTARDPYGVNSTLDLYRDWRRG